MPRTHNPTNSSSSFQWRSHKSRSSASVDLAHSATVSLHASPKLIVTGCLPGTGLSPGTCWACFNRRPDLRSSAAAVLSLLPLYVLDQHFIGAQCRVALPEARLDSGSELADRIAGMTSHFLNRISSPFINSETHILWYKKAH